jgi:hypothetical protein
MELTNFEYDCRFRDDHVRALCDSLRRHNPNVNTGCVYTLAVAPLPALETKSRSLMIPFAATFATRCY